MPTLDNLTPFAATDFLSLTKEGVECLVLVVAGSFVMPAPGRPSTAPLSLCDEQLEPQTEDVYWGEPEKSSLRYETQATYTRPATDVLLHGRAWAPRGRKITRMQVAVRVGSLEKRAVISGTRVWYRGLVGLSASDPLPFESLPLRYEHSFGGTSTSRYEARNPVGVGFYESAKEALDKPLPYIEEPQAPVRSWSDRPAPCGFSPVARHWQPASGLGARMTRHGWSGGLRSGPRTSTSASCRPRPRGCKPLPTCAAESPWCSRASRQRGPSPSRSPRPGCSPAAPSRGAGSGGE